MKEGKMQQKDNEAKVIIIFLSYLAIFYALDLLDAWSKLKNLFFTK